MENVIKIADHSVTIKRSEHYASRSACEHKHTTMDENGHTVQCDDCGAHLSAYWVLKGMLESFEFERARIERDRGQIAKDRKALQKSCPGCGLVQNDTLWKKRLTKSLKKTS